MAQSSPRNKAKLVDPSDDGGVGALWRAFHEVGLKILDVGARGGSLPWVGQLAPFSNYYGCEPDAAAAALLDQLIRRQFPWRDTRIITEALGAKSGPVNVNLTRNPGFSSILNPNMEIVKEFGLEEEFAVEDVIEAMCITLEEAAARYEMADLGLIKLDTQGSELEILKSGEALLHGPVQAVFTEVEFRQFYVGQPLFSEMEMYLRDAGFELIRLDSVARRRAVAGRTLAYSRHELTWGHALFMKRALPDPKCAGPEAYRFLVRQIAIAIAAEHFDLAADRLLRPDCRKVLEDGGLFVSADDLESYIARAISSQLYSNFTTNWPSIQKNRPNSYLSQD